MVELFCNLSGYVKVVGIPSHTEYIFSDENNHRAMVLEEDLTDLLSKTYTSGCCGNPRTIIQIFKKINE